MVMTKTVIVGDSRENGVQVTARCVSSCSSGYTSVETWSVPWLGEDRTFECYQDRRRQWTSNGFSSGQIADGVFVYFLKDGEG